MGRIRRQRRLGARAATVARVTATALVALMAGGLIGACAPGPESTAESAPTSTAPSAPPAPPSSDSTATRAHRTGVFIGVTPDDPDYSPARLAAYDRLIVDLDAFSAADVADLRSRGVKRIDSYLNVGALERARSYYPRFADLACAPYENWPDEHWVDIAAPEWRDFLLTELGPELRAKGADGFFIDNADVYGRTLDDQSDASGTAGPSADAAFDSLRAIIVGLREGGATITINGGDEFVRRLIDEGGPLPVDVIAQECVITRIDDYEHDLFSRQDPTSGAHYRSYVEDAKAAGLGVLLIEYATDPAIIDEVDAYCRTGGFECFVSPRVALDGE